MVKATVRHNFGSIKYTMKYSPVFLLVALLFIASCRKPKDGNFTLQLKAKYGDQSFAINTPNTDPQGRRIQLDKLKFYLSHITLVKTDNSEIELKEVMLCDFEAPNSLSFNVADINGDFKGIKFSCGIDSIQNNTDPNTIADDSNPLSNNSGMYWSWLKYIFEMVEARCDTTSTGSGPFNWFPLYHIGANAQYREVAISKTYSVCCDNKLTLNLVLDVKKIFYGSSQTLDIIAESTSQTSPSDDPLVAPKFADNFSQAFSIE